MGVLSMLFVFWQIAVAIVDLKSWATGAELYATWYTCLIMKVEKLIWYCLYGTAIKIKCPNFASSLNWIMFY